MEIDNENVDETTLALLLPNRRSTAHATGYFS